MKGMDIMKAMNDLDHDMLQEAEAVPAKSIRKPRLSRFGIIAAAVALLTVTAAAVGITASVSAKHGTLSKEADDLTAKYYGAVNGEVHGTYIETDFALRVIQLDEEHDANIKSVTTDNWKSFVNYGENDQYNSYCLNFGYCHDNARYGYGFKCVEDIEDFLGIKLKLSSKIREAAAASMPASDDRVVLIRTVSREEADKEYAATGKVSASGILIHIRIPLGTQLTDEELYTENGLVSDVRSDSINAYIYIALNEEYTAEQGLTFLADKNGTFHLEENASFDGKTMTMFYTTDSEPNYTTSAHVVYNEDGIGYTLSAFDMYGDEGAVELLKPYLQNWD